MKKRKEDIQMDMQTDTQMFVRNLKSYPVSQASKERLPSYIRKLLGCAQSTTDKLRELNGGEEMRIEILGWIKSDGVYEREIVMSSGEGNNPREVAYIKVLLKRLPLKARRDVEEGKIPFGEILRIHGIETTRDAGQAFRVRREGQILEYSNGSRGSSKFCYGKEYSIRLPSGKRLADVKEVYFPRARKQSSKGGKIKSHRLLFLGG